MCLGLATTNRGQQRGGSQSPAQGTGPASLVRG